MTDDLRYDFPVATFVEHDDPDPGETWEETMYDAKDKAWEKGERGHDFGIVTVVHENKKRPQRFEVTFKFGDGDTVTGEGKVPGNGSWKGKEKIKLRNKGVKLRNDEIEVDSRNPKRWG